MLPTSVIDIPIASGYDQAKDAVAVQPGSFLELRNVVYDQAGALVKRPGYTALPVETIGEPADLPDIVHLDTLGAELLAIGVRPQSSVEGDPDEPGPYLWSYSEEKEKWSPRSSVGPMVLRRRPALRSSIPLTDAQPFVSVANGIEVIVWRAPSGDREVSPVYVRARDMTSNAIVIDDTEIAGVDGARFISFACGNNVLIVWHDGATNFNEVAIDCTTLEIGAPFAGVLYVEPDEWDACPIDATTYVITATIVGETIGRTVQVGVGQIYSATLLAREVYYPTCASDGTRVSFAWVDSANGAVYATRYLADMSVDIPPALLMFPTNPDAPDVFDRLSCSLDGSGRTWVVADARRWISVGISSKEGIWTGCLLDDGGIVLPNRYSYHLSQITRPWSVGERTYIVCGPSTYNNDPTDNALALSTQFGAVVLCLSQHAMTPDDGVGAGFVANSARLHHVAAALPAADTVHVYGLAEQLRNAPLPFVSRTTSSGLTYVTPLELYAGQGFEARSYDVLSLAFDEPAPLWRSAAAQGALAQSGGLTAWYDGYSATELGFVQRPRWHGVPSVFAGSADPGTRSYLYAAVYAWRDGRGNLHLSEPSDVQTVTLEDKSIGSGGGSVVTLKVKTTHATLKGDVADGANRLAMIWIYRTLANAPEAYYLLDRFDLANAIDEYSVSLSDDESDTELLAAARGILYTAGGIIENRPPPASLAVCQAKNRLWLASANDEREVWFSKVFVAGEGPGFNEAFRLRIDDSPDGITALAPLDDKVVVFTAKRIYVVTGDGPNDTGGDGAFGGPFLVSSSAGCVDPRSVVAWQGGIFFQSAEGLCLLDRGLSLTFAGEPVRALVDSFPEITGAALDAENRRCLWLANVAGGGSGGGVLVFDYGHNAWMLWTYGNARAQSAQVIHEGNHVRVVAADGLAYSTATDTGLDDGEWYALKVKIPHMRIAALGGAQRVRRAVVQGSNLTNRTVYARAYWDQSAVASDDVDISAAFTGSGQHRGSLHLSRQKGSTLSLEIEDEAPSVLGGSSAKARVSGLALEVGAKAGTAKLNPTQRRLHAGFSSRGGGARGRPTGGRSRGRREQIPVGRQGGRGGSRARAPHRL